MPSTLLRTEAVFHRGPAGGQLHGVSLAIEPARLTLLSGSGSAALLRILGLLQRPDAGEVWFESRCATSLDDAALMDLRNHSFGFVFSEPFLLDSFNVAENVAMPLLKISGFDIDRARVRTAQVLEFTGLTALADQCVADLGPLDRHKISLARALANAPRVLIAEQAGAGLSPGEHQDFAALLRAAPDLSGVSVVATAPADARSFGAQREIRLDEGAVAADSHPIPVDA